MAETYLTVRIDKELFTNCRKDKLFVEKIINFNSFPESEKLDLNHYPAILLNLAQLSFQIPEVRLSLYLIKNGQFLLNPQLERYVYNSYVTTDISGYFINSDISYIDPAMISFVADNLIKLNRKSFLGVLPQSKEEANASLSMSGNDHPKHCLEKALDNIIQFYITTSQNGMISVLWED